jgi:hypothetical protein
MVALRPTDCPELIANINLCETLTKLMNTLFPMHGENNMFFKTLHFISISNTSIKVEGWQVSPS